MTLDYFALVIEASLSDLASGHYRSRMNPKAKDADEGAVLVVRGRW